MSRPKLRRLIDLPGMAELERKALMKPAYADDDARTQFPELDELARALFGLTADEAEDVERPAGWDPIETKPAAQQVFAFEDAGWDVTDDRRKPLRTLAHFAGPLWLAIRGVAGALPFAPEDDSPDPWGAGLAAEARRFKKR